MCIKEKCVERERTITKGGAIIRGFAPPICGFQWDTEVGWSESRLLWYHFAFLTPRAGFSRGCGGYEQGGFVFRIVEVR